MSLLTILFVLGLAPWRGGLADVPVRFESDAPYAGAMGLACDPAFRAVPGNAQSWCGDFEGVVLYARSLESRALLLNILAHEDWHLTHMAPGAPEDIFGEGLAYRAGCSYSWERRCETWLAVYPVVSP